ncbi:hypothetical protein ACO0E0_04770 [Curtobacterium sp. RRHDQ10]
MRHQDVTLHRSDPDMPLRTGAQFVVLSRGVRVETEQWDALDRLEQRRLRVTARYQTLRSRPAVSHGSAAAMWGLPSFDRDDGRLHVVDSTRARTHSGPGVVRHAAVVHRREVEYFDGVFVTNALRTVVDVIRSSSFTHAVLVLDHALRAGLVTVDSVRAALADASSSRGTVRAAHALDFADGASESPGESWSRVRIRELRLPPPELQREFVTPSGRFRVDFWWPAVGVVGEFDGRVKYRSGDPEALWHEKQREDALRRLPTMRNVARWTMSDLAVPARLAAILHGAGVMRTPKHRPSDETPP